MLTIRTSAGLTSIRRLLAKDFRAILGRVKTPVGRGMQRGRGNLLIGQSLGLFRSDFAAEIQVLLSLLIISKRHWVFESPRAHLFLQFFYDMTRQQSTLG